MLGDTVNKRAVRILLECNLVHYTFQTEENVEMSLFDKEVAENTTLFDWENFEDLDVKRQFSKLSTIGTAKLSEDKIERVSFKKIEIF